MNILIKQPPINYLVPDEELDKYSSAVTLSDMEIFIFPELLYSLVLANIMSPRIWAWRESDWFVKVEGQKPYRRLLRLKQYIIDHYEFNLDLDTWGLTDKSAEMKRFSPFVDEETLSRSNALFGYEGDKYYFDLDIRRHFGLDKYNSDIIPYWKTETVEAMDAFVLRPGYKLGAGECVSLSTLYAASMFVVCGISLDDIYLMATPLHSQNYVLLNDGVITNNRRIMTKNMWFNGTEQTVKAQRALRHEQVTIVSHHTGHIHCVYPEATIDTQHYDAFKEHLRNYLSTNINIEILANYLRQDREHQKCFQFCYDCHGRARWIEAEKVYDYESTGPYKTSDKTREKLLADIDEDMFYTDSIPGRICINILDDFFKENNIDISKQKDVDKLKEALTSECSKSCSVVDSLVSFARLHPRFPDHDEKKSFESSKGIPLELGMSRREIIDSLEAMRSENKVADLAFHAARDFSRIDWRPFMKAAVERNPVSCEGSKDWSMEHLVETVNSWANESIYDDQRMAQPDEIWNFKHGDGFEKAILMANILLNRFPDKPLSVTSEAGKVRLNQGDLNLEFASGKHLDGEITFRP